MTHDVLINAKYINLTIMFDYDRLLRQGFLPANVTLPGCTLDRLDENAGLFNRREPKMARKLGDGGGY
jgi:hypothetical protein